MNDYDFDGTIFYSDCSIGFALWCMKRHPKLCFTYLPMMIRHLILYKRGKIPNYLLQRKMFSYLTKVDDFDVATFDLLIDRLERCLRACGVVFLRHQSAPAVLLLVLFAIGISTAD